MFSERPLPATPVDILRVLHLWSRQQHLQTEIDCGSWEMAGLQDLRWYALLACRNTHERGFSFRSCFRFGNGISLSSIADFLPVRKPDPRSCPTILFQPTPF